jgi:hypothetical protein
MRTRTLLVAVLIAVGGLFPPGQMPAGGQAFSGSTFAAQRVTDGTRSPAQDPSELAPAKSEDSATSAATIPANLTVKLRQRLGQVTTVTGYIERTSRSSSGHHFLNFGSSELSVVCFQEHVSRFKDWSPADEFKNKNVAVTGTIELYRDKLQIRLEAPSQIRIVTSKPGSPAREVELKQVARDVWLSPAGLRYAGRDPAGLTRVEHIQRHLQDQPDRSGPHGVFDGGERVAFAVIDEAWQLAASKKIAPRREGDRSSYLVPLGRRVGFLGGRDGKERGNPPLQRVFIVFETGTKNIVTAYPR